MKHKTTGWRGFTVQEIEQFSPSLQTVNAHRQVAFGCETKLPNKHLLLSFEVVVFDPSIQTDFPDGGRKLIEKVRQGSLPRGRVFLYVPRVITERRNHLRVLLGQHSYGRPVLPHKTR